MAGKTGPDDGAEEVPLEPTARPEDGLSSVPEEQRSDLLSPGEPSWPEDPGALRAEALSEDGVSTVAPATEEPGPVVLPSEEEAPADVTDAEGGRFTPGRAGPPWDWEAPAASQGTDHPQTMTETDLLTADTDTPAASSRSAEQMPPPSEGPPAASAASGGASASFVPPPPRRRGGFGALVLGGMVAAALGFGAAWISRDRLGPAELTLPADIEERLATLEARPAVEEGDVQVLADRWAEAEARLQTLETAPAPAAVPTDLEPLREEVATGLANAQARVVELEERLAAIEARPSEPAAAEAAGEGPGPAVRATPPPDAADIGETVIAALEPRLAEIETDLSATREALSGVEAALATLEERVGANENALGTLDQRLGEAEAAGVAAAEEARSAAKSLAEAQARASEAETRARTGVAMTVLGAAIDRGEPLDASLSEVEAAGIPVPDALAQAAAEGVPTLAELREEFPEAARAGLEAAREAGLIDGGGFWGFLRGQFSFRSTAPREGGDPDANLSRAEAALSDGRLDAALQEIATLPEPVQAAMADWIARAQIRAEAEAALATLREAEPETAQAN